MTNVKEVSKDWGKRGFSFGTFEDPPGQRWEDYVHDVDELLMLAEGKIEVEISGEKLHPEPGDEIFIHAGETHSVRNTGATQNLWYYGYKQSKTA